VALTQQAGSTKATVSRTVVRFRRRLTTTPGKLWVLSALIVLGALWYGVQATAAAGSRSHAAHAARGEAEPLLLRAATLYTKLSDAGATETTTFLKGGLEQPSRRQAYLADLRRASYSLVGLTRAIGSSGATATPVRTIAQQLPVYSGFVESARADNLQGLPIGAAYLRKASTLLSLTILPAAGKLYSAAAHRLGREYGSGTATASLAVLAGAAGASLALLILAQWWLARVSRRILNPPIVLATILLLATSVWAIIGMVGEQRALARARANGSDSIEVLSATTVLLARAETDESMTLVNRGSDDTDPVDFAHVMRALAPPSGLIAEATVLARRTGTTPAAVRLEGDFARYQAETAMLARLEHRGEIFQAIKLSSSPRSDAIVSDLSSNLAGQVANADVRFKRAAAQATSAMTGLTVAIPLLTLLAASFALIGVRKRLWEYR
jgi:hypothetical protein